MRDSLPDEAMMQSVTANDCMRRKTRRGIHRSKKQKVATNVTLAKTKPVNSIDDIPSFD